MKRVHLIVVALSVLIVSGASYWWNRWVSQDLAHDIPTSHADNVAASDANARSRGAPTGHMPALHDRLIHGTKADDVIYGTEANERIEALAGNDKIVARGGDDILDGGDGADMLMGGPGNDTYVLTHHGGGGDILLEESGADTLQLAGRIKSASLQAMRHGDDLLIRWSRESPLDIVLIRSWFAGSQYHIEQLRMTDGTVVPLEPLAARAREATSEDLVHFPGDGSSNDPVIPR